MNKYCLRSILSSMVIISAISSLAMADSIKQASAKDVDMLLDAASGMNSAYGASYIGETRDRFYIEYVTAIHASSFFSNAPAVTVYWLPKTEISSDQLAKFKAYKEKLEQRK